MSALRRGNKTSVGGYTRLFTTFARCNENGGFALKPAKWPTEGSRPLPTFTRLLLAVSNGSDT